MSLIVLGGRWYSGFGVSTSSMSSLELGIAVQGELNCISGGQCSGLGLSTSSMSSRRAELYQWGRCSGLYR